MMRARICCRVSTAEQAGGGFGMDAQEAKCCRFVEDEGGIVEKIERWDESAKNSDRKKLDAMFDEIKRMPESERPNTLVFDRVNRLARDEEVFYRTLGRARALGMEVLFADLPRGGRGLRSLVGFFAGNAADDNDARLQATNDGMQAAREAGRWLHRPPLGYMAPPRDALEERRQKRANARRRSSGEGAEWRLPSMIPDPERAALIRLGFELWAAGYSTPLVLAELTVRELTTRAGRPLSTSALDRIRRDRKYYGLCEYPEHGIETVGDWEPIVDEGLWHRAQATPRRRGLRSYKRLREDMPLKGIVYCNGCGRPMTGDDVHGNLYYRCPQCGKPYRSKAAELDAQFADVLDRVRFGDDLKILYREAVGILYEKQRIELEKELAPLEKRLRGLKAQRMQIVRDRSKGLLDEEDVRAGLDEIRAKERPMKEKLRAYRVVLGDRGDDDLSLLEDPVGVWAGLPAKQKIDFALELYPSGVRFDGEKILTPEVSALVELAAVLPERKRFGVPNGGELLTPGLILGSRSVLRALERIVQEAA